MWTGPELEVASRDDLTAEQIALMLGRTYAAVGTPACVSAAIPARRFLAGLARKPGQSEEAR